MQEQSPFLIHRHLLLNDYGAARTLRSITLSLWNGHNWPTDLSRMGSLDERHFAIAMALMAWYRQYGENDPDFMATASDCQALALEEKRLAEQQDAYDQWERLVNRELGSRGIGAALTFDNYEWFFARFESGMTPAQAAELAITQGLH